MISDIISLDYYIENILNSLYNSWLFSFFSYITSLGSVGFALIVSVCLVVFLCKSGKTALAKRFVLFLALNELTVFFTKWFINRPRPFAASIVGEADGSFPSGHAAVSIFIYGFLAYYFSKNYPNKKLVKVLFSLVIILIGFSRLYLDVHYFSDVLGGYLIGALFLSLLIRSKN